MKNDLKNNSNNSKNQSSTKPKNQLPLTLVELESISGGFGGMRGGANGA